MDGYKVHDSISMATEFDEYESGILTYAGTYKITYSSLQDMVRKIKSWYYLIGKGPMINPLLPTLI